MGRKHPKDTYKQANVELLREKLKESKYTGKDVSVILGYASSWFDNMLMRNTTVSEIDMNKMAMLLGFDPADAYITEEPQKEMPAEKKDEATSNDEIVAAIKELTQTCSQILAELKTAINGPEPIALSKSERATEILRKALHSANGGGVKVEGFKKMLVQAQIGSAYMTEAISNLDCHKMVANNGIQYIMPPSR